MDFDVALHCTPLWPIIEGFGYMRGYMHGDEDAHLLKLLITKRRRFHELEEQRAYFGAAVPPHINMEITDLEEEINDLEMRTKPSA